MMFSHSQESSLSQLIDKSDIYQLIDILESCGFHASGYLEKNADLPRAGLDEAGGMHHFLAYGHKENRQLPVNLEFSALNELLTLKSNAPGYLETIYRVLLAEKLRHPELPDLLWRGDDEHLVSTIIHGNGKPYFIIGDSHSALYVRRPASQQNWLAPLHLLCTGVSAKGLANKKSRSGYGEKILNWANSRRLHTQKSNAPIFLKFGQVDAEFGSIFQRVKNNIIDFRQSEFEEFASNSVHAYGIFLDALLEIIPQDQLRICSIFPPTLSDASWQEGYVNAHIGYLEGDRGIEELSKAIRSLEIPSWKTRTSLHSLYNNELQKMCSIKRLTFVDDFTPMIGINGTIDEQFIVNHSGKDHHLELRPTEKLLTEIIEKFI